MKAQGRSRVRGIVALVTTVVCATALPATSATPGRTTYTATYRATSTGSGTGLSATYFDAATLTGTTVRRTDGTVDFRWGLGSPASAIGADTFSVRWVGQVEAQFSETYTFYTQSDDGVRLWVDGQRLVNNWTNHSLTENSGTIALTAGRRYPVLMEYFENTYNAAARLLWGGPSTPKAVVPRTRLHPADAIRINFQPASAPLPTGYLRDSGLVYGARGNGHTYGWNADTSSLTRDRNSASSPDQRYDTLIYLQRPAKPNAVWELAVRTEYMWCGSSRGTRRISTACSGRRSKWCSPSTQTRPSPLNGSRGPRRCQ